MADPAVEAARDAVFAVTHDRYYDQLADEALAACAPLIRRQALTEAADLAAYTADAVGHGTCAEAVAAAIRGLSEGTE